MVRYNGKYWFASLTGLLSSLTTISNSVLEYDYVNNTIITAVFRNLNDTFFGIKSYGTSYVGAYSFDGGATWNNVSGGAAFIRYIADILIFSEDSADHLYYLYTFTTNIVFLKVSGGTVSTTIFEANAVYGGCMVEGVYNFVYKNAGGDFILASFNETAISTIETLTGIVAPDTFNVDNQIYWKQGDLEIIMDQDHLYSRWQSGTWVSYSASGTFVNGIIWDYDYLGAYIISFIIWGNAIWEITAKGVLKKIQALEPRDYKKVYLTNVNEDLAGVVQFLDRNGNDDLGDWTEVTEADTFEVVEKWQGHKNILHQIDAIGRQAYDFTAVSSGTMEFWMGTTNAGTGGGGTIGLVDGTTSHASVRITNDLFYYYTNGNLVQFPNAKVALDNTIYHVEISWVSNTSLEIWVDGVKEVDIVVDIYNGTLGRILFVTNEDLYIDSLGGTIFGLGTYVSGSNKKINAYVGYGSDIDEAWFSTGDADTSVMQLSFLDYTKGTKKSLVVSEMYQAPKHTLIRRTKPFEDEWVKEYTDSEVLFYEGKVKDNDNDGRFFWKYLMNSWEDEYKKTKITASLSAYTHGELLKYIVDNYSKYLWYGAGTNADVNEFTAEQIDGTDDDWINNDGADCESTYVVKKAFLNGFMYNVLQQYDNSGANQASLQYVIDGSLIFSFKIVTSDITKLSRVNFYEGGNFIGQIKFTSSQIRWLDTADRVLISAVNNTIYHIALVFNATDDNVDIYIDGIFNSTQNLAAVGLTTNINKIIWNTYGPDSGYYFYNSQLYIGSSLVDAMHTYSSISPLLTDTYDFNLKSQTHPAVQKLIAEETGYIVSVRPSGQVYLDQYAPSGVLINKDAAQGITYISRMKIRNEKFSLITFYGGFVGGKQIIAEGFAEPNFGSHEDWFPTIDGREAGDLYYDADGNPKSLRLDAMVAKALADRNIVIKKQKLGKRGVGMLNVGTSLTYNNGHYKISMETWMCWRKNTYNALRDDNRVEIADSFLSPTKADPEDDRDSQVDSAIGSNADDITKNEQNIGALEEKTSWTWRASTTFDFQEGGGKTDFSTIGDVADTWYDLDLSAIVGAKKMTIVVHIDAVDNILDSVVRVRENGTSQVRGTSVTVSKVVNKESHNDKELDTDENGVIEIFFNPKPSDFTTIDFFVRAYRNA